MAEVLVNMDDQTASPTGINTKRYKPGDVVVVVPDGWRWGTKELNSPQFRILKFPKVTEWELQAFLSPEPETDLDRPSPTRWRRFYSLDLGQLPPAVRTYLLDTKRAQATMTVDVVFAQIDALRVQKTPVVAVERR